VAAAMQGLEHLHFRRERLGKQYAAQFNALFVLGPSLPHSQHQHFLYTTSYGSDCSFKKKMINKKTLIVIDGTDPKFCTYNNNNNNNSDNNNNNSTNNDFIRREKYNYTSLYHTLNVEGKVRRKILKTFSRINKHGLEDWRHCWVVRENINENISGSQMLGDKVY
jgi:hypothetical protein